MTFRVFFCAGACGLLPSGGSFGPNAAGLPCPGDFFGAGLSGAVCLLLHYSWESLWSRYRLNQSGLFRTILQAFLWSGRWLK